MRASHDIASERAIRCGCPRDRWREVFRDFAGHYDLAGVDVGETTPLRTYGPRFPDRLMNLPPGRQCKATQNLSPRL